MGITQSKLARNTVWMSLGQVSRMLVQAAYFILIARSLGLVNYGVFAGALAVVSILSPFGPAGRGTLLLQNVSRDRATFSKMWGSALLTILVVGALLTIVAGIIAHFIFAHRAMTSLVLLVGISDIIALNIVIAAGQAFQSFEQLQWTALLNGLISAVRLLAIVLLSSLVHSPSALQWGCGYCGSTILLALVSAAITTKKCGWPALQLPDSWHEVRQGLYFSISWSAQTIYNDIDKTMLARLSTFSATGIYAAAYRIIDVSFAPVTALLYSSSPTFFRKGMSGLGATFSCATKLVRPAVAYCVLTGVLILLCANCVPWILGAQFHDAANALRWLAILPLFRTVHYFLSDALTAAGHQAIRCAIQLSVAGFNILINLWLLPRYSWRGAAWSSIASDGLLALSIGICTWAILRRNALRTAATALINNAASPMPSVPQAHNHAGRSLRTDLS
jgi:O-antigen/teichoic acid export membrane protein